MVFRMFTTSPVRDRPRLHRQLRRPKLRPCKGRAERQLRGQRRWRGRFGEDEVLPKAERRSGCGSKNHGKTTGRPWENGGFMVVSWWLNDGFPWDLMGFTIYP